VSLAGTTKYFSFERSNIGCYVKEEVEDVLNKYEVWKIGFTNETNEGSYAAVNRVVPSSTDPLHNR